MSIPAIPLTPATPGLDTPAVADGPTVSAGANTSQTTAAQVTLTGTATAASGRSITSTAWVLTATTPAGVVSNQSGLFANAAALTTTFTPAGLGYTYEAVLSATDDLGQINRDSRAITVQAAAAPTVAVAAAAEVVVAGGTVALTATPTLAPGATVTSYAWTCTRYDSAGATTAKNAQLSTLVATPSTLTAEAASDDYAYLCTCVVTDSNGATGTGSAKVRTVAFEAPTVTVAAAAEVVVAGGNTVVTATPTLMPGATVASYAWTCTRYDAVGATTASNAQLSALNVANPTLTIEAGADDYGYRCACVVTDSNAQTGTGDVKVRTIGLEAPTGHIGDQQTVTGLAAFNCVEAGAPGITGAATYAWTAIQVADPDTSGAGPSGSFSDAAVQAPTFTPNWPCTVELTCAATGPGGVQTFRRSVKVNVAAPVAVVAVVADSDSAGAHTLDADSSTGPDGATKAGLTFAWTTFGPNAAPAIVDATDPTTTCTSTEATGAGDYSATCVATDAYGRTHTAGRSWTVGRDGYVLVADVDLTAGASQNIRALGAGPHNITVDGTTFVVTNVLNTTACTIGGGVGFVRSFSAANNWCSMAIAMNSLITGYALTDEVIVLARRTAGVTTTAQQKARLGWYKAGGYEAGCEHRHGSGVVPMSNFGGWVDGTPIVADPTIFGFRRDGTRCDLLYSTAAAGWPDPSALLVAGQLGITRDANDAAPITVGDMVDNFVQSWLTANAFTETHTAYVVWRRA